LGWSFSLIGLKGSIGLLVLLTQLSEFRKLRNSKSEYRNPKQIRIFLMFKWLNFLSSLTCWYYNYFRKHVFWHALQTVWVTRLSEVFGKAVHTVFILPDYRDITEINLKD